MPDSILAILAGGAAIAAIAATARAAFRRRWHTLQALVAFDVLALLLAAVALGSEELFGRWMQEDGWAEWGTFLLFASACASFAALGVRAGPGRWARAGALGLAAFCLFVAGEEVSWGQRLLAFKPPEMFLADNFQQELNVHNLIMTEKIGALELESRILVALVALGYGALAPAAARVPWIARRPPGRQLGAICPPPALVPGFVLVAVAELTYPVSYTGEASELVLGLLVFLTALSSSSAFGTTPRLPWRPGPGGTAAAVMAIALACEPALAFVYGTDADRAEATREEVAELAADLPEAATERLRSMSSIHKRLFTATRAGYFRFANRSQFLARQWSPAEREREPVRRDRRGYFLDPWNNPYWVRFRGGALVVYSFGANRRRDTDFDLDGGRLAIAGDDIAALIEPRPR